MRARIRRGQRRGRRKQKSLKERLIGTWHFVVAEVTAPDGTKSFPFGPKPRGMVIFTADGNEVPSRWKLWAQAWGVWEGIVKAERYAEWPGFRPAI